MSLARCVDAAALTPGPRLGQHSAEVLRELGVEDGELRGAARRRRRGPAARFRAPLDGAAA